jgi:hypothetical protein
MKKIFLSILFVLLISVPPAFADDVSCDTSGRDAEGWDKQEKDLLNSVSPEIRDLISRPDPCGLKLQYKNGKSKIFTSFLDKKYNDDPVTYSLNSIYEKQNYALIDYRWMNGERLGFILVSLQSGEENLIDWAPEWSPSGKSFATAMDNESNPDDDGAQVFLCNDANKPCKKAFELKDYRATQVYWLSSKELYFTLKTGYGGNDPETEYRLHVKCSDISCKATGKPKVVK